MAFPARYPGRCRACEGSIRIDDQIRMTDDGPVHDNCAEDVFSHHHDVPACPVCWLTHPEGACDR